MAATTPSQIYAIQAYSKTLNRLKQEFDEDALLAPYKHTVAAREAKMKAESLATRLNKQKHGGATDWTARYPLQDYKPSGLVRAAQIRNPSIR
tara:strand:+ start:2678 stop:2956 length:279 start_codon:yes stop_codon:yes gene_type:complete